MPDEQIIEDNWVLGWIPSSSAQADFGRASQGLLRMDNLTLDERGSLRLINRPTAQSGKLSFIPNTISAAYINGRKLRYAYGSDGSMYRNYGGANSLTVFDLVLGSGSSTQKAGFVNALGHNLALAGTIQVKDRGDIQWPLTIPRPIAPTLTNLSVNSVDLSNLDGSSHYTNWTSIDTGSFTNTGTEIDFTPDATSLLASFHTIYGSVVDTTNFGATGEDTLMDIFQFTFEDSDTVNLTGVTVYLYCSDPTAGTVTDYFIATPDLGALNVPANGVTSQLSLLRSLFTRFGTNPNLGWATIKAAQFVFTTLNSASTLKFSTFYVGSGATQGTQTYVAVELNDTGQFLQYSVASNQGSIITGLNNIQVDRSGIPCDTQCNNIRFYRSNTTLGQFIEVNRQTGAYGFTPASFTDNLSDEDALAAAALDPSKVLQFFRTNLPTTVIGGIYFASRVIYLTPNAFLPSFQLDLGTYDSRFSYELTGSNSELCLFVAKLSINTFIVATTVDFYQVTGTFATIHTTNSDGTVTTTLDVTIQPLGISDPAISQDFAEVEGTIFYMSARGLRSMANGSSALLNTTLDLLFRNEARYGFPPVSLLPNNTSLIGIVSSGNRVYISVPFTNGSNAILVSTFNPPLPSDLRGSNYWRPIVLNAVSMCREQDGTVLFGDFDQGILSLEDSFSTTVPLPIDILTQFNFGQSPTSTKTIGAFYLYVNTGGTQLTLSIFGLKEDGSQLLYTANFSCNGAQVLKFDPSSVLVDCIAYAYQISGETAVFDLSYAIYLIVQEYPGLTYYAVMPFNNFGKDTLKKLAKWGFVVDTLGNQITARVTADNVAINSVIDQSAEPQGISTEFWYNNKDVAALDWQLEIVAPKGMHFYKFMPPDILQIYPPGRMLDQVGPLDLDLQGIVFGFRVRLINEGNSFHYDVYDNDAVVYSSDVATAVNQDTTYIETLPKGINTSVIRLIITSNSVFYRFSLELKLRTTGKETDERWVKVANVK